jgi:hypothetical protein
MHPAQIAARRESEERLEEWRNLIDGRCHRGAGPAADPLRGAADKVEETAAMFAAMASFQVTLEHLLGRERYADAKDAVISLRPQHRRPPG